MRYHVQVQKMDGSEESFAGIDDIDFGPWGMTVPRPVRLEVKLADRTVTTKFDNWQRVIITALDTES